MTKRGGWEPTGFGLRLKELREKAGMTLAQLAEKAGCHWNTIAKMERGEQEPAWPFVLLLAGVLGVDCSAFTQEPAERPPAKPGRPHQEPAEEPSPEEKPKKRTRKKGAE